MTITMLAVFAALVWMAHRSVRATRPVYSRYPSPADGALALAARRFHAGGLTAQEFDRIAKILRT